MTALEIIEMNRAARNRRYRRHEIHTRIVGLLWHALIILALMWCFSSWAELTRIVHRVLSPYVTSPYQHYSR